MIGQIVGNYKIEQKLGEGGMGEVFRGLDMMLEREVAIKFLRPELASQPQVVERFRSEAVTLAKLNHPNVATLFNFMRQGDSFFMVLEFVRGVTLDNVIQRSGAIPSEQAIPLFCQVLDGIHHAHEWGIVHRDIKPANMMLTEKGTLKVLDFGIARILGTARMTRQGNIIGTIEYMSPEQVRGLDTDARSDIYSLGMLLYEMLTGKCPFEMQNEFELMKAQIEQMPVPPRHLNPAIPETVEQAIWKAIAKNPDERFQSAAEFRSFLLTAGYASTGRIEPLAMGDPNTYATRPLNTQPPTGASNSSSGYATMPSQPGYSTPSQPGLTSPSSNPGTANAANAFDATIVDGAAPRSINSRETRISTSAEVPVAKAEAFDPMKATRVGSPMGGAPNAFAQPNAYGETARPGQPAQPSQSFFSKLTWVHFAGAGVVVLIIFGVLVGGALFALSGSKKSPAVTPTNVVKDTPATQPTVQDSAGATQQAEAGTQSSGNSDSSMGSPTQPTSITPVPIDSSGQTVGSKTTPPTSASTSTSAPAPVQQRPASPPPSRPKSDGNAAAAEAARKKREAALRALDQ